MKVSLYAFASATLENIDIGVNRRKWAVRCDNSAAQLRAKAMGMSVGSSGIFYCSEGAGFLTVPFKTRSDVDLDGTDNETWSEPHRYSFDIEPLGETRKRLWREDISSFLKDSVPNAYWNRILLVVASCAFVASRIEESDW